MPFFVPSHLGIFALFLRKIRKDAMTQSRIFRFFS